MDLGEEIRRIAESWLSEGQFIVDVVISAKKGPRKVLVFVDGDTGFGIDDCAALSRHLSKHLDENNLIQDNYFLEVSTPGVDHPLKIKRQYIRNIGRSLKVKLSDKTVEGKLLSVDDEKIVLEYEIGAGKKKEVHTTEIPFSQIEKAFVMISFK